MLIMSKKDKKIKKHDKIKGVDRQKIKSVVLAPTSVSIDEIDEKPVGARSRPFKPATKHLVSMRFDPLTVNRIKTLADEWGVTQTRVVEKLIDEAWIRGGRKAE